MTKTPNKFLAPVLLKQAHVLERFNSGEASLDDWLRKRAVKNMNTGATKTYIVCPKASSTVAGFYAVCMGQILSTEVTGAMKRNMPIHIPAVILARLAVDHQWQGHGLGQALLHDAVARAVKASKEVSARLVIVHAISQQAEKFYLRNGFSRLPIETPTFALDIVKYQKLASKALK